MLIIVAIIMMIAVIIKGELRGSQGRGFEHRSTDTRA